MTNESALLGLLADIQRRIYVLDAENTALREELARRDAEKAAATADATT